VNNLEHGKGLRIALAIAVVLHLFGSALHGVAHTHVRVSLNTFQIAFVDSIVIALPLLGLILLWTRKQFIGAWTISLAMLGSLLFGFVNHYCLMESNDYVLAIPRDAWQHAFILTAGLITVTDTVGTVLGFVAVSRGRPRLNLLSRESVDRDGTRKQASPPPRQ
jgi:hypothetical protein